MQSSPAGTMGDPNAAVVAAERARTATAASAISTDAFSGLLGAFSAVQTGRADSTIEKFNASVADMQARAAKDAGNFESNRMLAAGRQMVGEQQAGFAGQGVLVGAGTAGKVVDQTAQDAQADAAMIRNNAYLEAWGFKTQARAARYRAQLARSGGNQRAIGSLLTSGGKIGEFVNRAELGQGADKPDFSQYHRDQFGGF